MGRNALIERQKRISIQRAEILAHAETADFIQQFAPDTPRRRSEFEAKLAELVKSHLAIAAQSVADENHIVTAKALGAKGGEKGGPARARSLSPEQRRDAAIRAVRARWQGERKRQAEALRLIRSVRVKRGYPPSRRAIAKHFGCSTSTAARYLKTAERESLNAPEFD